MAWFEWYSTEVPCHYQVKADDLGFPGDDMIMRVHRGVCVFLSSVLLFNQRPTIETLYNNSRCSFEYRRYILSCGFASHADTGLTTRVNVTDGWDLQENVVRPW